MEKVNDRLNKLISKNLIDFVGSDIHNTNHVLSFDKKINISRIKDLERIIENNEKFH